MVFGSAIMAISGWLFDMERLFSSPEYFFTLLSVPVIIGTLFLLPLKACLFNGEPPVRQAIPQPIKYRDPAVTFLLFFGAVLQYLLAGKNPRGDQKLHPIRGSANAQRGWMVGFCYRLCHAGDIFHA
ncbi:Uncharacterised protein [Serratia fonticola]|uniref:Uncharacterized protein n=1 Tax=Serratia fonticola TaxID=47917 RepID=A0A4U9TV60_SERFO|nr:Uncharacterised protein [Serratia fonticola]